MKRTVTICPPPLTITLQPTNNITVLNFVSLLKGIDATALDR